MNIKLAGWKNDRREKPSQPILKAGKPVDINGQEFWVSMWINAKDPNLATAIERMVDKLAQDNGSSPIVSVSLTPLETFQQESSQAASSQEFNDEIPF
tara:strand:- start:3519 stop:3812 length:294 start_codon:yes stop_codon:yes gene_type:complete